MIDELKDNQIFVFGSNLEGGHLAGAAAMAHREFGAEWGVGFGRTGQTFAIPTMNGDDVLNEAVVEFKAYAKKHPELEFLLTPVGTGVAGYSIDYINKLFDKIPSNVTKVGDWL